MEEETQFIATCNVEYGVVDFKGMTIDNKLHQSSTSWKAESIHPANLIEKHIPLYLC